MPTTKLTAAQFRDLCREVTDKRMNLDSCLDRETPAVAERLLQLVTELQAATLKRANRQLELLREHTIDAALLAHARRGYSEDATAARLVSTRRIPHAAHYMYDHPARGHDLEEWIVESVVRPDLEQLRELGLPADAQWQTGHRADGVQRWTYLAKRPMSAGTCDRCTIHS